MQPVTTGKKILSQDTGVSHITGVSAAYATEKIIINKEVDVNSNE